MTKTVYICDQCKKEAKWLYTLPNLVKRGLRVDVEDGTTEVCEKCLDIDIAFYTTEVCYKERDCEDEDHPDYEEWFRETYCSQ